MVATAVKGDQCFSEQVVWLAVMVSEFPSPAILVIHPPMGTLHNPLLVGGHTIGVALGHFIVARSF
jgi:hypothetical protein